MHARMIYLQQQQQKTNNNFHAFIVSCSFLAFTVQVYPIMRASVELYYLGGLEGRTLM